LLLFCVLRMSDLCIISFLKVFKQLMDYVYGTQPFLWMLMALGLFCRYWRVRRRCGFVFWHLYQSRWQWLPLWLSDWLWLVGRQSHLPGYVCNLLYDSTCVNNQSVILCCLTNSVTCAPKLMMTMMMIVMFTILPKRVDTKTAFLLYCLFAFLIHFL
jgi:hypothetical protein